MKIKYISIISKLLTACLLFTASVKAQTKQYNNAVPVVDIIEKERPLNVESKEIKTLEESKTEFGYLLSQEFLAVLLSLLILFLGIYVYFKYIRASSELKVMYKKNRQKNLKKRFSSVRRNATKENSKKDDKTTESPKEEEEAIVFQEKEPAESLETVATQLKVKRNEHANRIYQLLEKL